MNKFKIICSQPLMVTFLKDEFESMGLHIFSVDNLEEVLSVVIYVKTAHTKQQTEILLQTIDRSYESTKKYPSNVRHLSLHNLSEAEIIRFSDVQSMLDETLKMCERLNNENINIRQEKDKLSHEIIELRKEINELKSINNTLKADNEELTEADKSQKIKIDRLTKDIKKFKRDARPKTTTEETLNKIYKVYSILCVIFVTTAFISAMFS